VVRAAGAGSRRRLYQGGEARGVGAVGGGGVAAGGGCGAATEGGVRDEGGRRRCKRMAG